MPPIHSLPSKALQLFSVEKHRDGRRTILVHDEAIERLRRIKRRICVVCIAGEYRTGKSTLLNKLLKQDGETGFGVGGTNKAHTKGIWIHDKTIVAKASDGEEIEIVFLDSEGFDSLEEPDENYDLLVFMLINIFTDLLILNCKNTITTTTNKRLTLVSQITKQIIAKRQAKKVTDSFEEAQLLAQYFPSFLLVIRDHCLKLVDDYDQPITPKQYLEDAWSSGNRDSPSIDGSPVKIDGKAELRKCYQVRECMIMPAPVNNTKLYEAINTLPREQLSPEFVKALDDVEKKVYQMLKPKRINGVYLSGTSFSELIRSAIASINENGSVPLVEDSVTAMSEKQSAQLYQEAIQKWNEEYQVIFNQQQSTIGTAKVLLFKPEVNDPHIQEGVDKLMQYYRERAFPNPSSKATEEKLLKDLKSKAQDICDANMRLIRSWIQTEMLKFESSVNQCESVDAFSDQYIKFIGSIVERVGSSSKIEDAIKALLPTDKVLSCAIAVFDKQKLSLQTTIDRLQKDQQNADQLRDQLLAVQKETETKTGELVAYRAESEQLQTQLQNELKQLQESSSKDHAESSERIDQLSSELRQASTRTEELNRRLFDQVEEHGDKASERERCILEQTLLITELREQQTSLQCDLGTAQEEIQRLREALKMVEYWQHRAQQVQGELDETRMGLDTCQKARVEFDEERSREFSRMRDIMQDAQMQFENERQSLSDQVAHLEHTLRECRQRAEEGDTKHKEQVDTMSRQIAHAMDENRKLDLLAGKLKEELQAMNRSHDDQCQTFVQKVTELNAQWRDDMRMRTEQEKVVQSQFTERTLDLTKALNEARNQAACAVATNEEMKKRFDLVNDIVQEHKRLKEDHQKISDELSSRRGELALLRSEHESAKKRNLELQSQNQIMSVELTDVKRKLEMEVFKSSVGQQIRPAGASPAPNGAASTGGSIVGASVAPATASGSIGARFPSFAALTKK